MLPTSISRRTLIEKGILKGFVHDLETAKATGAEPTGNGERGGVTGKPGPGFSNLLLSPGEKTSTDMLAGIKYGLLVHSMIGVGQGNTLPDQAGELTPLVAAIKTAFRISGIAINTCVLQRQGVHQEQMQAAV